MGKTYLVTGAAGFIGMHLTKRILESGGRVIGYDNMNDYYEVGLKKARLDVIYRAADNAGADSFKFYEECLTQTETLDRVFADEKPSVVINLAAQAGVRYSIENPDVYIQSNIVGFANILEMCRHYKVEHLIYASSSSVYGSNKKTPFSTEDRVDNPISLYAATKKANELKAHTYSHLYGLPTTGLRFFTVYGPYGRPDMAAFLFLSAILEGKPINVYNNGDMKRDFTYIDDIVSGILAVSTNSAALREDCRPPCHVYNIGNNKPERLLDFIGYLEEHTGKEAIKIFMPLQQGDVKETFADIDDLIKDTGFQPKTPLKVGLLRFVDWYKDFYGYS